MEAEMRLQGQETVAKALVADGEGILAADETVGTLTKRFELKIPSTLETRRDYRELLFTTPAAAKFISGVIMYDETIRQKGSNGEPLIELLVRQGIIPESR
jgi:fructose-bisphosphate aldolase class I